MLKNHDAYLVGYYGKQNAGDDALLYAAASASKMYLNCKKLKVSVFGDHKHSHVADGQGANRFKGHERLRHYQTAVSSKRIIIGGGSVFHSERDIQLKRHLIGLANRKKSMAVGVSLGPFNSVRAERACQGFLNECGFIGVRDKESLDIAKALAPHANVQLTFDLAPGLLNTHVFPTSTVRKQGLAFNFCQRAVDAFGSVDHDAETKRIDRACELITYCWQQTGQEVYLVDFNGHPIFGDHHVHQQILAKLPIDVPAHHLAYNNDPIQLLNTIAGFSCVVGMRLHAQIFAYMAQVPSISLQYHNKCNSWSEQVSQPSAYQVDADDFDPLQVAYSLAKGLQNNDMLAALPVSSAVEKSLLNWSTSYDTYSIYSRHTALQQA